MFFVKPIDTLDVHYINKSTGATYKYLGAGGLGVVIRIILPIVKCPGLDPLVQRAFGQGKFFTCTHYLIRSTDILTLMKDLSSFHIHTIID